MQYKTENNIPNKKIIVGAIAGILSGVITKFLGADLTPDMQANIMILVSGLAYFIAGYFTSPGKGDGVITK
jgi:uncharacterized membrane protein YeaQ/YmgE (transglycosylase-associated protein family)